MGSVHRKTIGVGLIAIGLIGAGCSYFSVDHNHPNGFRPWEGGRLVEVIVEQNGKFYEVWGLTCECGFVEPEDYLGGGACPSVGPATGWTRVDMETLQLGPDATYARQYIVDVRSSKFKQ